MFYTTKQIRTITELPLSLSDRKINSAYFDTEQIELKEILPENVFSDLEASLSQTYIVLSSETSQTKTTLTLQSSEGIEAGDLVIINSEAFEVATINANIITILTPIQSPESLVKGLVKAHYKELYLRSLYFFYCFAFSLNVVSNLSTNITNVGLVQKTVSETSQISDKEAIASKITEIEQKKDHFLKQLIKYIDVNYNVKVENIRSSYIPIKNLKPIYRPKIL